MKKSTSPRRWMAFAILAFALVWSPYALAATPVEDLLREGLSLLRERNYEAALEKFTAATETEPARAEAWFLRGMAENRLGRPMDAYASLTEAENMGITYRHFDFEKGWAAVMVQKWDQAITHLERFELAKPGNPKTAEFIGRAYLGKSMFDKAEFYFNEAMHRDPSVKPTALYYLAFLENRRGNIDAANAYLDRLFSETPSSPLALELKEKLAQQIAAKEKEEAGKKAWSVGASLGYGFNDNVLLVSNPLAIPADVSTTDSQFLSFSANGRYDWRYAPGIVVSAGYAMNGVDYDDVGSADSHNHLGYLIYTRGLMRDLEGAVRFSYGHTIVDDAGFSNVITVRPALVYRQSDRVTFEAAYNFARINFFDKPTTPGFRDRDSRAHTLGGTMFLNLAGAPADPRLRFGFGHTWNHADGNDFDYTAIRGTFGVNLSLPWKVGVDTFLSVSNTDYSKNNSLAFNRAAAGALFIFPREDHHIVARVDVTRPIVTWLEGYGQYRHIDNDSNIRMFNYSQNSWSFGLRARY